MQISTYRFGISFEYSFLFFFLQCAVGQVDAYSCMFGCLSEILGNDGETVLVGEGVKSPNIEHWQD